MDLVIRYLEASAQRWRHAQRTEIIRTHTLPFEALWLIDSNHRRVPRLHHSHRIEGMAPLHHSMKTTEGYRLRRAVSAHLPDHHELARMRIRQRLEQNRIHRTKIAVLAPMPNASVSMLTNA